ncbi:hypothetical protein BKA70DRAFT_1235429 [Coprinopsis sp. MPI-PUGE-AT-0042]|nr:hypothetical protein BKA70DRAFT_1235429 [Coprinopsis sp. MPI-PUGE-AT-0042]
MSQYYRRTLEITFSVSSTGFCPSRNREYWTAKTFEEEQATATVRMLKNVKVEAYLGTVLIEYLVGVPAISEDHSGNKVTRDGDVRVPWEEQMGMACLTSDERNRGQGAPTSANYQDRDIDRKSNSFPQTCTLEVWDVLNSHSDNQLKKKGDRRLTSTKAVLTYRRLCELDVSSLDRYLCFNLPSPLPPPPACLPRTMDSQALPTAVQVPERPHYEENILGRLRNLPPNTHLKSSYDDLKHWAILCKPCKITPGVTSVNSPDRMGSIHWIVVTTPYPIPIPEIVTGYQKHQFRKDGRGGLQDRTQYPQFITPGFEWAVCIKKNLDSASPLRFTPSLDDCPLIPHSAINVELRVLNRVHFQRFEQMAGSLGTRMKKFLLNHPSNDLATTASDFRNLMFQAIRMLGVSNPYPDILLAVTVFQRSYIDLEAFLNYEEKHKPCLSAPDVMPWPLNKLLMGGITEDETEASNLYIMGIPFWLVRPAYEVSTSPDTLIGQQVDFEPPPPEIELEHFDPPFTPVFEGYPHRDMQRATQRICRHWAQYVIPSRLITHQEYDSPAPSGPSDRAHQVQLPSISRSSRSSTSTKSKASAPPPSFDPSKYLTPEGDHFPRMVPSWSTAINAIRHTPNHPPSPEPIVNTGGLRSTEYAISCKVNPTPVPLPQHLPRHQGPTTGNGKNKRKMDPTRAMNSQLESMLALFQSVTSVQWFASVFPVTEELLKQGLPATVSAEVYWEITEIAFRSELAHLDEHLLPEVYKDMDATGDARDVLVRAVFPMTEGNTVLGDYMFSQYPNSDGGLASTFFAEEIRAVTAFRELVKAWPDCPDAITSSIGNFATPRAVRDMHTLVASFYTQTFYNCYGRPPMVPHRLPPSALTHLAPRDYHGHLPVEN